ncbi:MAG: hypothetical protein J6X55_09140, partial [Victivallales bacterium]|nr:hypothetical protein [Victivallales bacterium]
KARRQTQIAPAFYLDPYFVEPNVVWAANLEWKEYPDRARYFARNLQYAMECTEEYMWTWGECGSWWRTVPAKGREREATNGKYSWVSRAPGVTALIRAAMMSEEQQEEKLKALANQKASGDNLLKNGDFNENAPKEHEIPSWGFWRARSKELPCIWGWLPNDGIDGTGCAFLQDAQDACWLQGTPVMGGDMFFVRARAKFDDSQIKPQRVPREKANGIFRWEVRITPQVTLRIRWQDAEKRWHNTHKDQIFTFGPPQEDGWRTAQGIVRVPANSVFLSMLLGIKGVRGKVLFDDISLQPVR